MGIQRRDTEVTFDSDATTPRPHSQDRGSPHLSSEEASGHKAGDCDDGKEKRQDDIDDSSASPASNDRRLDCDLEKGEQGPPATEQPQPHAAPPRDPNLIQFDGPNDPGDPRNFKTSRKWYVTMMLSMLTFSVTFSSSIFSQATKVTASTYGVSIDVATLGTSFTLLGFGIGPVIWGPLSEVYGRMIPLMVGYWISAIFQVAVAVAQNLHTILISRFMIGMFGSATLAVIGGCSADMWHPLVRGIASATFASATFIGPITAPIIGGFIVNSSLGWRWTAWVTLFLDVFLGVLATFTLPETFAPVILQRRAAKLRLETRNWALHSKLDEQRLSLKDIVNKYLTRPYRMLVLEPILLLVTIYLALDYGILYLCFFAYPISFQEVRGWSHPGIAALPFIGVFVGISCGCAFILWYTTGIFARKMKEAGTVVPELRLPPMMVASVVLPIGLFWFSWTSSPEISWVPQAIAGVPIGFGIIVIFLQGLNYIVDVYATVTNSALAANTLVRSLSAAVFPLFGSRMYRGIGVPWAGSILGFLAVAMIPIPFLFYKYGARIRAMSKFIPD
ncbi:hypothetical protein FQN57_003732 [Myotisia sp. PD_48]|nr:hypothetical protein FQN57_003732 [Myotisia sp. PD_48]